MMNTSSPALDAAAVDALAAASGTPVAILVPMILAMLEQGYSEPEAFEKIRRVAAAPAPAPARAP